MTGKELKKIRLMKQWTAVWLAERLGCSRFTIRNYEKEEDKPIPKAMALAIKALLTE